MADEGSADTFPYVLAGREIIFRRTTTAQLLMLQRIVTRIQQRMHAAATDPELLSELMTQLNNVAFEAAESRFMNDEDLSFVQTEVLRGNITEAQIMGIITNGKMNVAEPDDDADPAPAKPVRKAAAKKPAKTANPRRVAR